MSKEYYTIDKKSNLGDQYVSPAVFHRIAMNVVEDFDKVDFEGGAMGIIPGTKGPLKVTISKTNQVQMDMDVMVDYGVNVSKTVTELQSEIASQVLQMMDMRNIQINVNVKGIHF